MRLNLRVVLVALVALVAAGATVTALMPQSSDKPSASGPTWFEGACSAARPGVTLAIDFGDAAGRDGAMRCVQNYQGNGWDVIPAAGFSVQGTDQYPTGFTCRIEGWPMVSAQDCADTPTYKEGFWAYYFASPDDSAWRFSGAGATQRTPECGGLEGWRFISAGESAGELAPRFDVHSFSCEQ